MFTAAILKSKHFWTARTSREAPSLALLAREGMSLAYNRVTASFAGPVPLDVTGNGQPVLVLPGFMASDRTTARLRHSLDAAGFVSYGWNLGRNKGVTADLFQRIDARLDALELEAKIILVGWSLGGLIAREYAKHAPHRVAKVITLGSPFSGNLRANNAWRVYEFIVGHSIDNPPIETNLSEKPPVPTYAFWSPRDGVVAANSARGQMHETDSTIELDCTHMAFVAHPDSIRQIARSILD
jgi:pimeloyl-ACP methyl ester carboxylesterase